MESEVVLHQPRGRKAGRLLRHMLEMIVLMMLGMCVLGAAFSELHVLVFGSSFDTAWHRHLGLTSIVMAFNMSVPMVLWMHYRGHSWERGGEMAAAMSLPVPPLLALYWLGVMGTSAVLTVQMALMIPAMIGLMLYRVDEYSAPHHKAAHPHRRRWFAGAQ